MKSVKRTDDTDGKVLNLHYLNDSNENSTHNGNERYYCFGLVIYDTNCDIKSFCELPFVNYYAYILHNYEETDPHYHLLVTSKINYSCINLCNKFKTVTNSKQNVFCRPIRTNEMRAFAYLTHSTDECIMQGKHRYKEEDIVTNDISRWITVAKNELSNLDLLQDLFADTIDVEFMCRKYGRDFMIHYRTYMQIRNDYLNSIREKQNNIIKEKIKKIMGD